MVALLGLHTIVWIKNSHEKWHRKCLNTMCVRSDVFSTANMEQKELSRLFVHCYILKKQQERGKYYNTIVVASSSPVLWSLPHFVATLVSALIGCSSFYASAPRLDMKEGMKEPRHPVFTANSQLAFVVDCGGTEKKPTTSWCASYSIAPLPRLGGMHLNSSRSFRMFFHPYSFNKSWYNNAAGSSQRPAGSL